MSTAQLQSLLGWCALIDIILLTLWLLMFTLGRDFIYRLHSRWFHLSPTQFDAIHYAGMALLKMFTLIFFLIPYLVLRLSPG